MVDLSSLSFEAIVKAGMDKFRLMTEECTAIRVANSGLESLVAESRNYAERTEKQLAFLNQTISQMDKDHNSVAATLAARTEEVAQLQGRITDLNELQRQAADNHIDDLKWRDALIATLDAEIKALKEKGDAEEVAKTLGRMKELEETIRLKDTQYAKETSALQHRIKELEESNRITLVRSPAADNSARIAELEKANKRLKKEAEDAKVDAAVKEAAASDREMATAKEIIALRNELEAVKKQKKGEAMAVSAAPAEEVQKRDEIIMQLQEMVNYKYTAYEDRVEQYEKSFIDKEHRITIAIQYNKRITRELNDLKAEQKEQKKLLKEANDKLSELQKQHDSLVITVEMRDSEVKHLLALRDSAVKSIEKCKATEAELVSTQKLLARYQQQVAAFQQQTYFPVQAPPAAGSLKLQPVTPPPWAQSAVAPRAPAPYVPSSPGYTAPTVQPQAVYAAHRDPRMQPVPMDTSSSSSVQQRV
jgi:hypothetical protein